MVRSCFLLYSYKPTLTYPNVNSHEPALLHLSLVLSLSVCTIPSCFSIQNSTWAEWYFVHRNTAHSRQEDNKYANNSGQTDWRWIGSGLWENSIRLKSFKDICALSQCLHKIRVLLEKWRCHVSSRQQKRLNTCKISQRSRRCLSAMQCFIIFCCTLTIISTQN